MHGDAVTSGSTAAALSLIESRGLSDSYGTNFALLLNLPVNIETGAFEAFDRLRRVKD